MQQGSQCIADRQWQSATSFLGCSYELSEWLLQQPETTPATAAVNINSSTPELSYTDRFTIAGHYLAECLGRNGDKQLELHYLLSVHLTLLNRAKSKLGQYWLLKQNLEISLTMLQRFCHAHGSFKGFHDCYLETRLCIDQCLN